MPDHGYTQVIKKSDDKNAWDYEEWKAGKFIPTPNKLNIMKKLGFIFPENVETVEVKDVMKLAKKLTRQQHGARRVGSQELNQNTPFHPNVESTRVGTQELNQDTVSTKTKKVRL